MMGMMDADEPRVPNRVRELRENKLMTQAQLARKAKVALRTIHSVEKGMNCRMDTKRKILLALYGLLLLLPLALLVVGCGRGIVFGGWGAQIAATFLRPVQATGEFFFGAWQAANWAAIGGVVLGIWVAGLLVGSFFGMAVTRMAAVELTSDRRSDLKEALGFARNHWHWGFFTPAGLLFGAMVHFGFGLLSVTVAHALINFIALRRMAL